MECPECNTVNESGIFCFECGHNLKIKSIEIKKQPIPNGFIEKFKSLSSQIDQLQKIPELHEQQRIYLNNVTNELNATKNHYSKTKFISEKERKDVERLEKFTWDSLKARMQGTREAMLEKEEAELVDALNKEEAAKQDMVAMEKRYNNALSQFQQVKQQFDILQSLTEQRLKVVHEACAGVTDPIEDKVEAELDQLVKQRLPILQEKQKYNVAKSHVNSALQRFQQVARSLQSASRSADWDTFWGGGFFADNMKHSQMADARNALQAAYRSLQMGYQLVPNLPPVTNMQIASGSYFWDVAFDNFFSDMRVREQINNSLYQVNSIIQQMQQPINFLNQRLSELDRRDQSLYQQIQSKQNELTRERIRIMEEASSKS